MPTAACRRAEPSRRTGPERAPERVMTMRSGPAWLDDMPAHLRPVLSRYLAGGRSEAMILMQLACLEGDAPRLAMTLRNARRHADPAPARRMQTLEIGRATWRERVCQYV